MATKRVSTSRSRKGCKTCKIRHVRCDETIPACFRCTSTGRTCDGYLGPSKAWPDDTLQKTVREPAKTTTTLQLPHMVTPIYSLPFRIPGSQKERQILHYYCVQGAFDLSGYMNPEFWTQSILCTSHHEPVVRQALIALSSIKLFFESEYRDSGGSKVGLNLEVQEQYVKALRRLRKYIATNSEPSKTVVLQCCILFYCFEVARGVHESALQHLRNGFSILQSGFDQEVNPEGKHADSNPRAEEGLDEIREIMVRLDLQASLYDNTKVPLFRAKVGISGTVMEFATLSQARSSLDSLMNQFSSFLMKNAAYREASFIDIPIPTLERKQDFDLQLQKWKLSYDTFCKESIIEKSKIPEKEQKRSRQLLEIHYYTLQLFFNSAFPINPTIFGRSPNLQVEEILRKAEDLIASYEKPGRRQRTFSAETGIIAPLFLIAMKVTDPTLASRVVQLLLRCNRREGLYDSEVIAQLILEIQRTRNARQHGVHAFDRLEERFSDLVSSSGSLESAVADIADLPGGLSTMAKILGIDHSN